MRRRLASSTLRSCTAICAVPVPAFQFFTAVTAAAVPVRMLSARAVAPRAVATDAPAEPRVATSTAMVSCDAQLDKGSETALSVSAPAAIKVCLLESLRVSWGVILSAVMLCLLLLRMRVCADCGYGWDRQRVEEAIPERVSRAAVGGERRQRVDSAGG